MMNYKQQKQQYIQQHPKATAEEAYEAGYMQAVANWCRKEK